jgi:SAM-dependent methyltransferase
LRVGGGFGSLWGLKTSPLTEYYAARAPEYERIYRKPERQENLKELRESVRTYFAGKRVLEIACGTGYWTEVLGESAESVTALDINEEVLGIARSKPGNSGVEFRVGDAYDLPELPCFSGCLSVFWWSHIPTGRLAEFLEGLNARLLPGARVMFIDNRYVEGNSTPINRTDLDGNTYQRRTLDDGSSHEVLKNFPTAEELLEVVAPFGARASVRFLEYYWVVSYEATGAGTCKR